MTGGTDTFDVKLPWQDTQWQRLVQMHNDTCLPHALLFSGPLGVGKNRFALAFAYFLMCESPIREMPCGDCRQCRFNKAGTHPDLKLIKPEQKGKQIKVDQIREVVEFISKTSQQGGYKVTILSPAESMNINSANALLKSLEEPSPNTLLILLTQASSQLLATVRSRCQNIKFPVPTSEQALQWLEPLVSSQEQANAFLSEASGQPLTALELLETDGISRSQQMKKDFLSMLSGRQLALSVAQKWLSYDLSETLIWLYRRYADLINNRCADVQISKEWQALALTVDVQTLFHLSDKIIELKGKLDRGANPNQQLALEELLLESCEVFHSF